MNRSCFYEYPGGEGRGACFLPRVLWKLCFLVKARTCARVHLRCLGVPMPQRNAWCASAELLAPPLWCVVLWVRNTYFLHSHGTAIRLLFTRDQWVLLCLLTMINVCLFINAHLSFNVVTSTLFMDGAVIFQPARPSVIVLWKFSFGNFPRCDWLVIEYLLT